MSECVLEEFTGREKLVAHVDALVAIISRRNDQIERLQTTIEQMHGAGITNQEKVREYRRGWKDAANTMMGATQDAANALGKLRSDAFELVLQAEREATAESRAGERGERVRVHTVDGVVWRDVEGTQ